MNELELKVYERRERMDGWGSKSGGTERGKKKC